ncbi:hypothetical protein REPUB_Repub04eG0024500 [Reevesia pubescens]
MESENERKRAEHGLKLLQSGNVNRHFGETNMNARSSRSHTIFRMVVESKENDTGSSGDYSCSDAICVSVLKFSPWEVVRHDIVFPVRLFGRVELKLYWTEVLIQDIICSVWLIFILLLFGYKMILTTELLNDSVD